MSADHHHLYHHDDNEDTTKTNSTKIPPIVPRSSSSSLTSPQPSNHNNAITKSRRERERQLAIDEAALIIECCDYGIGGSSSSSSSSSYGGSGGGRSTTATITAAASVASSNPTGNQTTSHAAGDLDDFHLFSVISDPRYFQPTTIIPTSSSSSTPSSPSRYTSTTMDGTQQHAAGTSSSYFDTNYYYHSFESTVSSVTGQMEALNHVLEDWSRQLLSTTASTTTSTPTLHPMDTSTGALHHLFGSTSGDYDNNNNNNIPESQLKVLPSYLQQPDTTALQSYLRTSGPTATKFYQSQLLQQQQQRSTATTATSTSTTTNMSTPTETSENVNKHSNNHSVLDVSNIPIRFFQSDFDLTDPLTFQQLLFVRNDPNTTTTTDGNSELLETTTTTSISTDDDSVIRNLLPLVPADYFNTYLDTIELGLLQQVRQNSNEFFVQSQNFGQIQEQILSLIQQTKQLQYSHDYIDSNFLQPIRTIPSSDIRRNELQLLDGTLQQIEDLMYCKHGLSGVLSAHDDLTAIEQIQYTRKLLNGSSSVSDRSSNGDTASTVSSYKNIPLKRLHAFQGVPDQLNQYESLVVSNLRDEIIEVFLSWRNIGCMTTTTVDSIDSSIQSNSTVAANNIYNATFRTSSILSEHEQQRQHLLQQRVKEILNSLRQCHALTKTKEIYTTRLQDVIRMTVRTTVGEFASSDILVVKPGAVQSVAMGTSAMTLTRFLDCLDLIFEQLLLLLHSASSVNEFFISEGLQLHDDDRDIGNVTAGTTAATDTTSGPGTQQQQQRPLASVIATTSELISKSISELLRLRKDAHSLVTLSEMKAIWDSCITFANQVDALSGGNTATTTGHNQQHHTSTLRTTLLAQVKLFVERRQESNMSSLAAALDSERWIQCEVSVGRQDAVTRLCSGLSINTIPLLKRSTTASTEAASQISKRPELEVEGTQYKVVWSCLLLIEMILANIATTSHFQSIATNNISKVSELLRLFNSRTTQLVLGAGAIHSHAKLKSINAKHLSLVTQCLGVVMAIIPHIRAALMTHLPKKQHMLLNDLDQIRKEYNDHNEKVLNKFVSIIGGIVEHSLARTIPNTDFDLRAKTELSNSNTGDVSCCVFLEGVATNIRKMHQVLFTLLPPDHLIDTFSRIFAFVDTKVPILFIAAANIQPVFQQQQQQQQQSSTNNNNVRNSSPDSKGGLRKGQVQPTFVFPRTSEGKRQLLLEIEAMTKQLNGLDGVRPWDFAAINVMERQLEYSISSMYQSSPPPNDIDTDSNPASETVSVSDDVLSTTSVQDGIENNTSMIPTNRIPTEKGDVMVSSIDMATGAGSDSVPVESVDTAPMSVALSSASEMEEEQNVVDINGVETIEHIINTNNSELSQIVIDVSQQEPQLLSVPDAITTTATPANGLLEAVEPKSAEMIIDNNNNNDSEQSHIAIDVPEQESPQLLPLSDTDITASATPTEMIINITNDDS